MVVTKLMPALAALVASASPVYSQDICRDIIAGGVFDMEYVQSSSDFINDASSYFCMSSGSISERMSKLGISIPVFESVLAAPLGVNTSNRNYLSTTSINCGGNTATQKSTTESDVKNKYASKEMLARHNQCVDLFLKAKSFGLVCDFSIVGPHNSDVVTVSVTWRPTPDNIKAISVNNLKFINAECDEFLPSELPPYMTVTSFCNRPDVSKISTMALNAAGGSCTARISPEPGPAPPKTCEEKAADMGAKGSVAYLAAVRVCKQPAVLEADLREATKNELFWNECVAYFKTGRNDLGETCAQSIPGGIKVKTLKDAENAALAAYFRRRSAQYDLDGVSPQ